MSPRRRASSPACPRCAALGVRCRFGRGEHGGDQGIPRVGGGGAAARPLFLSARILRWPPRDGHSRELGRVRASDSREAEASGVERAVSGQGRLVPGLCSWTGTFTSTPHLGGPGSCWVPRHHLRCARGQIPGAQSWHIPRGIPTGKLSKAQAACLPRVREVCTRSR